MYVKTQWVDNTTPIDKDNLNKIEQGIYDNSLVVDAVTNTLNPTDTETYKTAELTEGQITDVIGVSDIVIKGQTSQDGEPTPSSPVDVNVVSGSNVINTSNKNLLNINNAIAFRACTIQLQNNSIKIITDGTNNAIVRIPCVLTAGNYYLHFEGNANIINVAFYNSNEEKIISNNPSSSRAITLSDNLAYININLSNVAGTYTLAFNKLYINLGSTDLSYEPHQGKELPLDLGNIELCKIGNYQDYFYKSGSKWYLHKEINKKVLNGTEYWEYQNNHRFVIRGAVFDEQNKPKLASTNANKDGILSTNFIEITPNETYSQTTGREGISYLSSQEEGIAISCNSIATTTSDFKTWLADNPQTVYYILKTIRNTEITDTTLISQLEAIYNAPLYEQTNITQTNNDLPMVLDITACKDNINGIKAFIRK